eukprot:scaffold18310_cov31-Tisochrysis_lutea.AAC.2
MRSGSKIELMMAAYTEARRGERLKGRDVKTIRVGFPMQLRAVGVREIIGTSICTCNSRILRPAS